MTTKKRQLWLLIVIMQFLALPLLAGHHRATAQFYIQNEEQDSVSGYIDLHIGVKFLDSVTSQSSLQVMLPDSWSVALNPVLDSLYAKGDSAILTLRLQHPTGSLPYYPTGASLSEAETRAFFAVVSDHGGHDVQYLLP